MGRNVSPLQLSERTAVATDSVSAAARPFARYLPSLLTRRCATYTSPTIIDYSPLHGFFHRPIVYIVMSPPEALPSGCATILYAGCSTVSSASVHSLNNNATATAALLWRSAQALWRFSLISTRSMVWCAQARTHARTQPTRKARPYLRPF